MKRITKTRALEIYSIIYPEDDVRKVPKDYYDKVRRDDIAWEIEEVWFGEEDSHRVANIVLCDLLRGLGYENVVSAYDAVVKWYA